VKLYHISHRGPSFLRHSVDDERNRLPWELQLQGGYVLLL